jgi:hypothetical protein
VEKTNDEDAVWRWVVEAMLDRGATRAEAVEAANLVMASSRRDRTPAEAMNDGSATGASKDDSPGSRMRAG